MHIAADYNFPLVQFYRYANVARLKGAEKAAKMEVEYAAVLRVEFIPEGCETGPGKDIYFKVFKKGSCGILGAVFGWPQLDHPSVPGGEGLGWIPRPDGFEYSALNVTLPRLEDHRKDNYLLEVAKYTQSNGQLMTITEQEDACRAINDDDVMSARLLQAAHISSLGVPTAKLDEGSVGFFSLEPGERAVVPVKWNMCGQGKVTQCSTHPYAPQGLSVLPGMCDSGERMSLVVENEGVLPITITERDVLAAGVEEGILPTLDDCLAVLRQQVTFCNGLDWKGGDKDAIKVVESPKEDAAIVVITHKCPRFVVCEAAELGEPWKDLEPVVRVTTLTYEDGDLDYIVEDTAKQELSKWTRMRPWCGQTAFTFPAVAKEPAEGDEAQSSPCFAARVLPVSEEGEEMLFSVDEPSDVIEHRAPCQCSCICYNEQGQRRRPGRRILCTACRCLVGPGCCWDAAAMLCHVCAAMLPDGDNPQQKNQLCVVCENRASIASCGCCPNPTQVCGACCLLRHTEGRYQVHKPNETAEVFESFMNMEEDLVVRKVPSAQGLVLVGAFDGIGGARRALEIVGIEPALYISIESDGDCAQVLGRRGRIECHLSL